ncbi:DUF4381 domain-containing protein [Phyllobacterium sp. NPDC097923]|uniref:DUF4381 domain-containing protein n=1 Tax=Phyllobacterium sp. NPDC097923 TaxID=3364404 RepID=UPI00383A04EA
MAELAPMPDDLTNTALKTLADIALPPDVSWMPQTWGWAVLAGAICLALGWSIWRWARRWRRNRYRREAINCLRQMSMADLPGHVPVILKRTALAAWPRQQVASLTGKEWVTFLERAAPNHSLDSELARFIAELEYVSAHAASGPDASQLRQAAIRWIGKHHVST